ncbi:MAG: GNAT family N-acetyltransferase [Roseicyclus sp.]|nr:GNAT family N-acetyltransferase [Roseicyclus sp.]MBO6624635.1 GNAT family N-acetyltransferase [Roseicyclus sp.]MBO6921627.1 GNAT family N-acetyltransferase [Roseicyclus sp.]
MTPTLAHTPVLETERLILRVPQASDFPVLAPFVMSDRARYIGGGADKAIGHAWRVLAILTGHWPLRGFGTFVLEDKATGLPIGSAGPWYPEGWPEKELGWTIWAPEAEGKGYAYEAMLTLRAHAYADLGWTTAVSYIDPQNSRSIALAERLGCRLDETAARPHPDEPGLVYRHPAPEALA